MRTLLEYLKEAENKKVAVGHFNISDLAALKAIIAAARELDVPIMIGTSEGEREFIGEYQAAALIKSLREEFNYPVFLNADHTHSLEKVKIAAQAGYDEILFDGGKLPLEENIKQTKQAVEIAKSINPNVYIEGELGYIGSSSEVISAIPEGAAVNEVQLTTKEEALRFVKETGVDFLAPAVGNLHGMLKDAPNPRLNIGRIKEIKEAIKIPIVLHGGSGTSDEDFTAAIDAGINVVHINTEIRLAWRKGIEAGLENNPDEIAPYKIFPEAIEAVRKVVEARLKLFNKLGTLPSANQQSVL
ncbi:MAG: class II fructose-bisphosphate aldolase [Patescibacteria group bacterium]|nr:class II fructose-bisphosphate aldolase [Patescibacteria group bacterium]